MKRIVSFVMFPFRLFAVELAAGFCVGYGVQLLFSWWFAIGALMLAVPAVLAMEHRRLRGWAWGFYSFVPAALSPVAERWQWLYRVTGVEAWYLASAFVLLLCILRVWHRRAERQGKAPFNTVQPKCFATLWGY